MKPSQRIWVSRPRRTAPRILERTFVGDSELLERLITQVEESAATQNKHYNVIAGPDGIGKSHLLAVICNRIEKQVAPADLVVAWLPDDPGSLASELHFFEAVLAHLGAPDEHLEELRGMDRESAAAAARTHILELLGGRTLLLCVEHLDQVLDALGEPGQRALRAFFQQERCCTVLATATEMTRDFTNQERPFFGFFSVHRLEPMDANTTTKLLARLARVRGDKETAASILSPEHRPTLRALHHMLGGLPSCYVDVLRGPDDLQTPERLLLRAIDEHERWQACAHARLSRQQHLILHWLATQRGAVQVKHVARACFISEQTVSPQLRGLRKAGLVTATPLGREAWYEVRDPLTGIDCDYALELFGFLLEWYADAEHALRGRSPIARRLRDEVERQAAEPDARRLLALPALERRLWSQSTALPSLRR